MAEENAETVRRAVEASNRADLEGLLATMHPQVVWEESHREGEAIGLQLRLRANAIRERPSTLRPRSKVRASRSA